MICLMPGFEASVIIVNAMITIPLQWSVVYWLFECLVYCVSLNRPRTCFKSVWVFEIPADNNSSISSSAIKIPVKHFRPAQWEIKRIHLEVSEESSEKRMERGIKCRHVMFVKSQWQWESGEILCQQSASLSDTAFVCKGEDVFWWRWTWVEPRASSC